jgi:hypothetical protein
MPHDPVLIAAAFCMYNRHVDGLATWATENAPKSIAPAVSASPRKAI